MLQGEGTKQCFLSCMLVCEQSAVRVAVFREGSTRNVKEVFLTLQKGHNQFHGNQQLSAVLGDFDCMKVLVWPF